MDKKEIGQQIKKARKNAKMTQLAVAGLFPQCSRQSVMNWEAGLGFPSRERWPVLEQAFGLPAGWFLTLQSEGDYLFDDASRVVSGNVTLPTSQIHAKSHVTPSVADNEGASPPPPVQPMERMLDGLSAYKEREEARPSKRSSVLRQVVAWMDVEFARENLSRELDFMDEMKEKFPSFKAFTDAGEGK